MRKAILAMAATSCVAAISLMCVSPTSARADDMPLIWQPTKNSDTSYSVRLGLRLPTRLETEAGIEMGVDTNGSGGVVDAPMKLWSTVTTQSIQRPAYEMDRSVAFDVDRISGSAGVSLNYDAKHTISRDLDIEHQSSYGVRYDSLDQSWTGLDLTQSVRFAHPPTGTAFVVRATAADTFALAGGGFGLEQKLGDNITLTGNIDQVSASAIPVASINASYNFKW